MSAQKIDNALARAARASRALSETRTKARDVSIRAIRDVERRVVEALAGEQLRGMPNLAERGAPLRAMRVNAWSRNGDSSMLPRDGREVLVFTAAGRLAVARLGEVGPQIRHVTDDELVLEDLSSFVGVVQEALERHIALVDRRVQSLKKAEALAKLLIDAVGLQIRTSR